MRHEYDIGKVEVLPFHGQPCQLLVIRADVLDFLVNPVDNAEQSGKDEIIVP